MTNMNNINLLLFGDQTVEKLSSIQNLVRYSKTSHTAHAFLQQATDILQLEFAKLNAEQRGWDHEINSLLGLAEANFHQEEANGIVATVLMFIGRIGELIVYAEEDHSILGSEKNPTEILAFCTGLLPAAVAAAARDSSEVLKLGTELISVIFRMSYEISRRMRLVEDTGGNWATTVIGVGVKKTEAILDEFHSTQNIPEPRKLAIGVVANDWLTLIGPPSSLKRLWSWSPTLEAAPKAPTDTNGPIHTSHMPTIDIDLVLGSSSVLETPMLPKATICRNSTGGKFDNATLGSLLREMITEIAHKPLKLSETLEGCISGLSGKGNIRLTTVGPTGHLPTVQRCLQQKRLKYEQNGHKEHQSDQARGGSDHVAIVGMSGRFPGSETIDGFWESLVAGKNMITKVPKSRFDLEEFFDPTGKKRNSTTAQHGSWLDRPGMFDNRLFNISPREAAQMDPIQRLLLTTSYEALEVAGYSPDATPATLSNRIATYFGQTSDDWHEVLNNEGVDIYYVPSLARAFGPSRLNYNYKWGGGSFAIDSACATSTTAISLACSALIARECDTALAGGGSVLESPNSFSGLSRSGMISTTGGCRTYHDDADGYARGEGVGVIVLKRVEDAISDNDNILGVIRGSARTYSSTATSITHPDGAAQHRVYDEVLRQTCVDPNDVSYVEMHGTGTQAGDATEMNSVLQTVGQARTKDNPLTVGAVKANVGHGEAAAGVTSLIKVLMMMRERMIPTQPDMPFKINHNFPDLDKMNVRIAGKDMQLQPRPGGDGKTKVLLNSFDASGGNTALVIEAAPEAHMKTTDTRPYHVVTLSGRSAKSLQGNMERMLDYLERNPETKLADLAYTTTARRMHQPVRVAYTASTTSEIISRLRADKSKPVGKDTSRKNAISPRVFAFTGQGVQCLAMGKDFYQHSSAFRALLTTYQDMVKTQGLPHFLDLIADGCPNLASERPSRVHLAIVALEIAVAQMAKGLGVQPEIVVGHSLGEYAALCVSGVLSVSDTLHLVGQRALLIEEKLTPGEYAMLAVRQGVADVQMLLDNSDLGSTQIACINGPNLTVVSGTRSDVTSLQERLQTDGTRATLLDVPYGFHSKQVEPILSQFENIAKGVVFKEPQIPVASTLLATVVKDDSTFSPAYLARQAREPVNFVGALYAAEKGGFANERTQYIEVGPEPILSGLIRATLNVSPERIMSILKGNENDWKTICACLAAVYQAGASVNWPEFHKSYQDSLTLLNLPTYAFDEKDYWTAYHEHEKVVEKTVEREVQGGAIEAPPNDTYVPGFPSPSLQRVEHEDTKGDSISVTFASHTSQPDILAAIQGHVVDGITMCPLSVFCDMALSAASYAHAKLHPGQELPTMSVHDIELTQPVVVQEVNPAQVMKVTASYSSANDIVGVSFSSTDGKTTQQHGDCQIAFDGGKDWTHQFNQTLFLLKSRINSLKEAANAGQAHRLLKPMVYKMFASLVKYGENYHALDEVYLDPECHDAVGMVTLPSMEGVGNFEFNPYWMDATVHLAGFLLNGSMKYPNDIACLSTGFDSWRTFKDLAAGKTYTTYVCMQEGEHGAINGDAYVFDKDELVLATSGIRFQKMKRVVMRSLLLPGGQKPQAVSNVKAPQSKSSPKTSKITQLSEPRKSKRDIIPASDFSTPARGSSVSSRTESSSPERDIDTPVTEPDNDTADEVVDKLLAAVAAESGYEIEEMGEDTQFTDMGLDSLMAITTIANLKNDIGVELSATFFVDNPTIGEAKAALGVSDKPKPNPSGGVKPEEAAEAIASAQASSRRKASEESTSSEVTELESASEDDWKIIDKPSPSQVHSERSSEPEVGSLPESSEDEEKHEAAPAPSQEAHASGPKSDLQTTSFELASNEEPKVESKSRFPVLPSPSESSAPKAEAETWTPPKKSTLPSLSDRGLKFDMTTKSFQLPGQSEGRPVPKISEAPSESKPKRDARSVSPKSESKPQIEVTQSPSSPAQESPMFRFMPRSPVSPTQGEPTIERKSRSWQLPEAKVETGLVAKTMLLQESSSPNAQKVFLLPDWSGSPASYIQLPSLGDNLSVYGIESPYKKEYANENWSIQNIVSHLLTAIKKEQPTGPYVLGGASFGALYAFEITRKLLAANEEVSGLLLLDMFVPKPTGTDTAKMQEELETAGLITPLKRQTKTQKDHLEATIKAFLSYEKMPLEGGSKVGRTLLVAAHPHSTVDLAHWIGGQSMTESWQGLLGGRLEFREVEGGHAGLMRYPNVNTLGEICREALDHLA